MDKSLTFLIDVFAKYPIEEIDKNKAILQKVKAIYVLDKRDKQFYDDLYLVRPLKENIETILSIDNLDSKSQAEWCLYKYWKISNELNKKKNEVFGKLIQECFYKTIWKRKKNVKAYYDNYLPFVVEGNHFFFSYTNRNAFETNKDFEELLELGSNDGRNHLAEYLFKKLSEHNLIGFWDEKNLDYGSNIEKELSVNCKKVFCFVQLIEQKIFSTTESEQNWCHKEYLEFKNNYFIPDLPEPYFNDLFLFVIQDDRALSTANTFPVDYWIQEIKSDKHLKLTYHKDKDRFKLRKDIDDLANKIFRIREDILNHLLN